MVVFYFFAWGGSYMSVFSCTLHVALSSVCRRCAVGVPSVCRRCAIGVPWVGMEKPQGKVYAFFASFRYRERSNIWSETWGGAYIKGGGIYDCLPFFKIGGIAVGRKSSPRRGGGRTLLHTCVAPKGGGAFTCEIVRTGGRVQLLSV